MESRRSAVVMRGGLACSLSPLCLREWRLEVKIVRVAHLGGGSEDGIGIGIEGSAEPYAYDEHEAVTPPGVGGACSRAGGRCP